MATVFEDKAKKRLGISFYYKGRRRKIRLKLDNTRDNRRRADRLARDITAELKDGTFDFAKHFPNNAPTDALPVKSTIGTFARHWLSIQGFRPVTVRDYEYLFRVFLDRTALGAMLLHDVKPQHIREAIAGSTAQRRIVMFLQRIRGVFELAIEDGLIADNPGRRVKNPKPQKRAEIKKRIEGFSIEERTALLAAAKGQDRNFLAIMMGSGARLGELLAVRRDQINLKHRTLLIDGSVNRFYGEGPTKTGNDRVIDLMDVVTPVVASIREQMAVPNLSGLLFVNATGGFIDLANWRDRTWRAILSKARLPYRNPNALRHTYAIAMLEAGYDPVFIAKQMGHTSTEMIHRHYARFMGRTRTRGLQVN